MGFLIGFIVGVGLTIAYFKLMKDNSIFTSGGTGSPDSGNGKNLGNK